MINRIKESFWYFTANTVLGLHLFAENLAEYTYKLHQYLAKKGYQSWKKRGEDL